MHLILMVIFEECYSRSHTSLLYIGFVAYALKIRKSCRINKGSSYLLIYLFIDFIFTARDIFFEGFHELTVNMKC